MLMKKRMTWMSNGSISSCVNVEGRRRMGWRQRADVGFKFFVPRFVSKPESTSKMMIQLDLELDGADRASRR